MPLGDNDGARSPRATHFDAEGGPHLLEIKTDSAVFQERRTARVLFEWFIMGRDTERRSTVHQLIHRGYCEYGTFIWIRTTHQLVKEYKRTMAGLFKDLPYALHMSAERRKRHRKRLIITDVAQHFMKKANLACGVGRDRKPAGLHER